MGRGIEDHQVVTHGGKHALENFRRAEPDYGFARLFFFQHRCFAQELPTAKPESVGLSSERLERISGVVQHEIEDKRIAGAVTLVIRRGKVAWFKAQGMADREAGKAMPTDAMFRICSMTKPITSVAVMMLYEEGKFLLDDPVSKYLPEFKNPKVLMKPPQGEPYTIPATKEITIRDLLRHTSGLTYNWNEDLGPMYEKANVASGLMQYDGTIGDSVKSLAASAAVVQSGRPVRIQSWRGCAGAAGGSCFGETSG